MVFAPLVWNHSPSLSDGIDIALLSAPAAQTTSLPHLSATFNCVTAAISVSRSLLCNISIYTASQMSAGACECLLKAQVPTRI